MEKFGPDFYDEEKVFDFYIKHRNRPESPNETMEQPLLWDLIGDPQGMRVLDLGCGDARVAKKFKNLKAQNYMGIEGSKKMALNAQLNMDPGFSEVSQVWLEEYTPSPDNYDLVVSSLALHYVKDLTLLLNKIHLSLKRGGRFIFSVEHPVITSCNKSLESSALRQAWIVDDYFNRGARNVLWMGDMVTKYHRTIEDFVKEISKAKFALTSLREAEPTKENFADEELWQRRRRIPLFLLIEATKF